MFIVKENGVIVGCSPIEDNLKELGFKDIEEVSIDNKELAEVMQKT